MGRLSINQGWVYSAPHLLWTDDAGASWSDITPAGLLNCLEPDSCYILSPPLFLDAARARITVVRGRNLEPPTELSFMYTENGGRTWGLHPIDSLDHALECPSSACLNLGELEFPDPQHGWLTAYAPLGMSSDIPYMYRTRDGGQSWTPQEMPVTGLIEFIDASTGWAVGGGTRWTSEFLMRTQDGGVSWHLVDLNLSEADTAQRYYFQEPVFFSAEVGVLPVRFQGDNERPESLSFYVTQNAGSTWTLSGVLEDPGLESFGAGGPIPWTAVDQSTWFVPLNEDRQLLTHDRGSTWEDYPATGLAGAHLFEVEFVTETEGWGIGQICDRNAGCAQPLFATHDGGQTWAPLAPAPP